MNIVYASDEKFVPIMMTSMLSLLNNNGRNNVVFYVINNGILPDTISRIAEMCAERNAVLNILEIKGIYESLGEELHQERGSISTFSRLFVASLLPDNVDRILYLDCDTIICDSLEGLWNMSLRGKCVGAVKDAFSSWHKRNISYSPDEAMFNAGVLLINLTEWRQCHIEDRIRKLLIRKHGKIPYADQGILNCVLKGNVYWLEPKYDVMTLFYDLSYDEMIKYRKVKGYYSKQEIEMAKRKPVILHFVTIFSSVRPWYTNSDNCNLEIWDRYFNQIQKWYPASKTKYVWKGKTKVIKFICESLNRKLAILLLGIMHSYVLPGWQRIRMGKTRI